MTYCNPHTTQNDILGLQQDLLQPTHTPPSMTWDCSMTCCIQHTHTTQYDLLGLQYDVLQPTPTPLSMTYWTAV